MDMIEQLSNALADRIEAASGAVVALRLGRRVRSGLLWAPDVVATSDQVLDDQDSVRIVQGGREVGAKVVGRDPATNVAVLRLETPLDGALPPAAGRPRVGTLATVLGADAAGAATGRLATIHAVGPEWHSQAGGRIDAMIRLDTRLSADEGGPVLDHTGAFLGMSALGPRRRVLAIPAATLARVVGPLLAHGRIPRGYLGIALKGVALPEAQQAAAGQARAAMAIAVAAGGPAAVAGILQGDVLLNLDGVPFGQGRVGGAMLGSERIGQAVSIRLLRAGEPRTVTLTIGARPAA